MRKDPFESPVLSMLFLGGVLLVCMLVNLVRALVLRLRPIAGPPGVSAAEMLRVALVLGAIAVGAGCTVALARRIMRAQQMRRKNLVAGAIIGAWYSAACWVGFGRDMPPGVPLILLQGLTFVGVWYAMASGLNSAFEELSKRG